MGLHLRVVNPNRDATVSAHLAARCAAALPVGSTVTSTTNVVGPPLVETEEEAAVAASFVAETVARDEADAYVIGCFGNHGVASLRAMTRAPIVGLGEAALLEAKARISRVGALTTLAGGIPSVRAQVEAAIGPERCIGVVAVDELSSPVAGSSLLERLAFNGASLLAEGADGLVLACASFGLESAALTAMLGVPVCDGASFAGALTHTLWQHLHTDVTPVTGSTRQS